MYLKGTHNSASGEPSNGWFSRMIKPFVCTQTKSIIEQFNCGCRFFDLHIGIRNGIPYFSHGLWSSTTPVYKTLHELNVLASNDPSITFVKVTYEGTVYELDSEKFVKEVQDLFSMLPHLELVEVAAKKPGFLTLYLNTQVPCFVCDYPALNSSKWDYFAIPKWRNLFYERKYEFNNDCFVIVDFL